MGARLDYPWKDNFKTFPTQVHLRQIAIGGEKLVETCNDFSSSLSWLVLCRKQYVISPPNKDRLRFYSINGKLSTWQITLHFFTVRSTFVSFSMLLSAHSFPSCLLDRIRLECSVPQRCPTNFQKNPLALFRSPYLRSIIHTCEKLGSSIFRDHVPQSRSDDETLNKQFDHT